MIEYYLVRIVQATAIVTVLIFLFRVFPKRISSMKSVRQSFFEDRGMILETVSLSGFYIYLYITLFFFDTLYTPMLFFIPGVIFALLGLLIALAGRYKLGTSWTPVTHTHSPDHIIQTGVFKYVRHPIYLGRILFFMGVMLMLSLPGILLGFVYWYILQKKAIHEENYLQSTNAEYKKYMTTVRRGL